MPESAFITRIENASGEVIAHKNSQKRVMNRVVADKMTSMMLGTFTNGTGISSSPDEFMLWLGKLERPEGYFLTQNTSDQ